MILYSNYYVGSFVGSGRIKIFKFDNDCIKKINEFSAREDIAIRKIEYHKKLKIIIVEYKIYKDNRDLIIDRREECGIDVKKPSLFKAAMEKVKKLIVK
ncbi:hypothetical protein SAMN02745174_02431 [Cetobacterium ceti]|uniref:Uncharacterized protein n=1 Tax=Cetobacterium ceti TaxID=180163 RepID=A0A1T4QSD3_9FUSO|nr:hypothetical protein [Cetobacterium ceti]SKA06662.1 hypothetical protein SAMN02745174_02431 [Cetobacterium ceti]